MEFETNNTILLLKKMHVIEPLRLIAGKVLDGERISVLETVFLYEKADLGYLSVLANFVRTKKNGKYVYFNRNFHIEPTNTCIFNCKFCSYHKAAGEHGSWEMSMDQILNLSRTYQNTNVTEVHIVGGVHPKWDINYYGLMIKKIKEVLPNIHIKAYSAIELDYVIRKARLSYRDGMRKLKGYGLDSIPGGGAEIFNHEIRDKICGDKPDAKAWLNIHEAAHLEGIPSNATILYGHIENYKDRAFHMDAIRELQDKTGGFNCFIPLKFRSQNNHLSYLGEVNEVEDMRNFAVSRIFFDNINHIKAYWPMLGRDTTKLALAFGVDDIDGTIDDTTKIYSMAGAEDQKPIMTEEMFIDMVESSGGIPVERDSLYKPIHIHQL